MSKDRVRGGRLDCKLTVRRVRRRDLFLRYPAMRLDLYFTGPYGVVSPVNRNVLLRSFATRRSAKHWAEKYTLVFYFDDLSGWNDG